VLAQAHDLLGVGVIADRQLAGRDDALGLEADVEQDLVAIDLDDRALDQVTIVELDDGVGHHVFERRSTEVVFGDGAGDVIPLRIEGPHRFGDSSARRVDVLSSDMGALLTFGWISIAPGSQSQ